MNPTETPLELFPEPVTKPAKQKVTLRDYQLEAHKEGIDWYDNDPGLEALIALTMGMGKTITAATFCAFLVERKPDFRILWLTHREELIEQSKQELELYTGLPCEVEQANRRFSGKANILVASIATLRGKRLANLANYFTPDLIICDEAHHALALTWMQVKQTFAKTKVLNLTATPYRADISNRLDLGRVLIERNTSDGIRMKVLVPPKPVGKLELDLGKVKKRLGDYDTKSLASLLCHEDILAACTQLIMTHATGHKGILFAASVEHGQQISAKLRAAGLRVGEVYGETPTSVRQGYYRDIRQGQLDILVNNLCLDAETEVLTQAGWKTHATLTSNDLVANWENGRIWFSKPKDIIVRKRQPGERMVSLRSRQKSIRVTKGHRMLARTIGTQKFHHIESQDLIGKRWEYPVSGSSKPAKFSLPKLPKLKSSYARRKAAITYHLVHRDGLSRPRARKKAEALIQADIDRKQYREASQLTEWDCRFIGFWIGDGASDLLQSGGIEHKLYQGETWPNVIQWVETVCQNLGVDYLHKLKRVKSSKELLHVWSFPRGTGWGSQKRQGVFHLEPYLKKTPNPLLWNLNQKQFDAFLEGYWFADGNHLKKTKLPAWFEIRGSRKELFDQIQAIAVCRGYKASLRPSSNWPGKHGNNQQDWILTLAKKPTVNVASSKHLMHWDQTGSKDETVWCVSTESTNIITRREGCVAVMGNCLTEGFDLPALDLVVMLRPTKNAALYLQAIGRGLRVDPNNPNKKECLLIDIIDTAKRRGGEAQILPTDDDVRVFSALHGRTASHVEVFLNWFWKTSDVTAVQQKEMAMDKRELLDSADKLFSLLAPPWAKLIPTADSRNIIKNVWTPDGEYQHLFKPFRIAGADAFCLMLARKGWVYIPHNKLPDEEELAEKVAQGAMPPEEDSNYNINTLIAQDANLQNFLIDLFDPNQSLKEQAAKCYTMAPFANTGHHIAWFKVIYQLPVEFTFIQWKELQGKKTNHILVRDQEGKIYKFEQHGFGKITHQPGGLIGFQSLPDFVKGTNWANSPMSEKQATHVCKILNISASEAASLNISKLAASALMSNHWNRKQLQQIASLLVKKENLKEAEVQEPLTLQLSV